MTKRLVKRLIAIHVILGVLVFWLFVSTTPANAQMAFEEEAMSIKGYIVFVCNDRPWRVMIVTSDLKKLSLNLRPEQTMEQVINQLRHYDYDVWVLIKDMNPQISASCGVFE